jgi:parallel beta-helix repeat protein
VSYINIEGLTVEDCRWLEAADSHHNVIRGNTFARTPSSGTTGNVRIISSDHNQIVGNVLDDGNDNILLIDSDHNLVEGNTITEGRHSVFSIRCSNYNIIRGNYFSNSQQKIGEVYDCGEDTTIVPHAFDATKHNVFEQNVFAEASSYYSTSGGNGIQYGGQEGIIRRNVFYHTNVGLCMQVYSDESLYNHHNRAYHNVFYDNDCAGVSVRGDNVDNIFVNNILFRNRGTGGGDCFGTGPAQILYRGPLAAPAFSFRRNNILNEAPGEAVIQQEFGSGHTLAYFESNYPALFFGNLEVPPGFRDEGGHDFGLWNTSPVIDAGAFLAHTVGGGSGTTLQVDDARFFHDGFGIEGVTGDTIQLEGQTGTATVVGVDYSSDTLTLDRPLSWNADQGVSLAYEGTAPDLGAYEHVPELVLHGAAGDSAIRLNWSVDVPLPMTTTWRIDYYTRTAGIYTATDPLSVTRSTVLAEHVDNYRWYTVTLHAMLGETSWLSDTVRVMPTDRFVYFPLMRRGD